MSEKLERLNEKWFDELSLEAWGNGNYILIACDPEGNYYDFRFNVERSSEFDALTNALAGMFRRNRRRISIIPRWAARPKRLLRTSKLAFESGDPSFWQGLNGHRVTKDIFSRIAAHAVAGITGAAARAVAGFFAGRASV